MSAEWISGREVIQRVNRDDAAQYIAKRCKDGIFSARATLAIVNGRRKEESPWTVPASAWVDSVGRDATGYRRWAPNIGGGDFTLRAPEPHYPTKIIRYELYGVEFCLEPAAAARASFAPNRIEPACESAVRERGSDAERPTKRGRPDKRHRSLVIFRARLAEGVVCSNRADESRAIVKAWGREGPPRSETVSAYLAPFFMASEWMDGALVNAAEILALVADKIEKKPD